MEETHDVRFMVKSCSSSAYIIEDQHVQILGFQLFPRVFQHVAGFSGKAYQNLILALVPSKIMQDIREKAASKYGMGVSTQISKEVYLGGVGEMELENVAVPATAKR